MGVPTQRIKLIEDQDRTPIARDRLQALYRRLWKTQLLSKSFCPISRPTLVKAHGQIRNAQSGKRISEFVQDATFSLTCSSVHEMDARPRAAFDRVKNRSGFQ